MRTINIKIAGLSGNVDADTLALLKKHGFQWYRNASTDRVEANSIKDVIPAANGFTVVYNEHPEIVFVRSTAIVEKIERPDDLEKEWIRVCWISIEDQRKTA